MFFYIIKIYYVCTCGACTNYKCTYDLNIFPYMFFCSHFLRNLLQIEGHNNSPSICCSHLPLSWRNHSQLRSSPRRLTLIRPTWSLCSGQGPISLSFSNMAGIFFLTHGLAMILLLSEMSLFRLYASNVLLWGVWISLRFPFLMAWCHNLSPPKCHEPRCFRSPCLFFDLKM